MTFMTLGHNHLAETRHKPAIPEQLKNRRTRLGLSRRQVASDLGFDQSALQRWEMEANNQHHRQIKASDYERLIAYYDAKEVERHKMDVPRGTIRETGPQYNAEGPSEPRFPLAVLLRRPAIRIRLSEIRTELAKAEASPEQEENVMTLLNDRARIAKFSGGSVNDDYTEADVLMAIDNIAEIALRTLAGPTL